MLDAVSSSPPRPHTGRPPGPPEHAVVQNSLAMLRDPLPWLLEGHARYGDVIQYRLGPQRYWVVSDLDAIRRVLVENSRAYVKSQNYVGLRLVLGNGLVTSEGELHKRQRRLASPGFHHRRIESFVPIFAEHTERMLAAWAHRDGESLDAHKEMMSLTLKIVGECLFDAKLDGTTDRFGEAVETVLHFANDYALSLVKLPLWLPTPRRRAFGKALDVLDSAVAALIEERRAGIAAGRDVGTDLLGAFLSARDDDGSAMSNAQLRDEVLTMLAAGHETTANALSFALHLLSLHPVTERAVHQEVSRVLRDEPLTAAHLPQLELLERVLKESMRLLPSVWMIERQNVEDDWLGGYRATPGTVIAISPWVLHRDPRHWPNPGGFDPDRWLPEVEKTRPRYAYLPFGAGPRVCIGAGFAMTEAKVLLALILRRAKLASVPGHPLALDPNVTLRPRGPLVMKLSMR